jgi:hypothetical protein
MYLTLIEIVTKCLTEPNVDFARFVPAKENGILIRIDVTYKDGSEGYYFWATHGWVMATGDVYQSAHDPVA